MNKLWPNRERRRAVFAILIFALVGAGCADALTASAPAFVETRLVVEVVQSDGAPVAGASVGITNPASMSGCVWHRTTDTNGRAVVFDRSPDAREWLPVSITVHPPIGAALSSTVRADSMRFQRFPVLTHVARIVLAPTGG